KVRGDQPHPHERQVISRGCPRSPGSTPRPQPLELPLQMYELRGTGEVMQFPKGFVSAGMFCERWEELALNIAEAGSGAHG
ncbi:MAG: hypothetical protein L0G36_03380, partial [Brevibacterium sp.]|nr:hypothetical protein [Brevibacterium sp.]